MENTENPNEVLKLAREFENKFRESGSSTKLKKDYSPEEVMVELGFKKVKFSDLEKGLQNAMKKPEAFRWHGYPVDFGGRVDAKDHTIMSNEDGSVLYFFHNKSDEGMKTYGCSKLRKMGDTYCVEQLRHNFNIGEIINAVSLQELISKSGNEGERCGLNHIEINLD